jgi:hypothetical protein
MDQTPIDPAAARMQALIEQWQAGEGDGTQQRPEDRRVIFLRCYLLMTNNMLAAIERQEFHDSDWVGRLLHRFAGYYFTALEAYEASARAQASGEVQPGADSPAPPPVWQLAFQAAHRPGTLALQHLLLGVNAHINYDLILALVDILEPEWDSLTEEQRNLRYQDHCRVNRVIGETVDAVQDEVLDPEMPVMEIIDRIMGRVDEAMISHLLAHWRDVVWHHANRLLEIQEADERQKLVKHYEKEVIELGELIQLREFKRK